MFPRYLLSSPQGSRGVARGASAAGDPMPPKKKEKGGKGLATGLTAVEEPPQPVPGAPYCLRLVFEVSIDAVEPSSIQAVDADVSQPLENSDGGVRVREQSPALVEPVFRYTFVNGDNITTPPVGQSGSSWRKVDPAAAPETPSQQADATVPVGQQDIGNRPPKPVMWRYTRVHQLRGADDEEVALILDRKPQMLVTLADKSLHEATVQPAGQGAGDGTGNTPSVDDPEGGKIVIPGRNFIESWPLDLSAFLAGETSVTVYAGRPFESEDVTPMRSISLQKGRPTVDAKSCSSGNLLDGKMSDAPPAPEGIHFMSISVSLPGVVAADEDPTKASEVGIVQAGASNSTPGGAIVCPKLLSTEVMERLNPLSIKVTSATSLPGVRIEADSHQDLMKPTPFRLLEHHCKPVYIVCRPFPDDPLGSPLHPRVVWTAGSAHQGRARFDHISSFLLGPMDRHRLEDWAENFTLSIEVHDRDPRPSTKDRREQILRLERMISGGYPVEDWENDHSGGEPFSKAKEDGDAAGGNETASVRYARPRDIYDVDEQVLREAIACAESAGKHNAHGVASFRLSGLLNQSRQLVRAYSNTKRPSAAAAPLAVGDVAPVVKTRSEICQRKRREIPKGGIEDWHLSDEERFVRWPGAYLDAGSSLGLRLSLAKPLRTLEEGSAERTGPATEEPRLFTRAVLVVEYEEGGELVRDITVAMDQINGRALKNVQGSLRAYRFTQEEKLAVDAGTLDVVCGFTVIDEDSRTIVLEGLAGPQGGLTVLLRQIGRAGPNGQAYHALENPEVRFSRRRYSCFDADLKKVRLRDPLPVLCRNPEIYDRSKVSADCFDALHSLRMLRTVNRMREAAEHNLFPEAEELIQVESKYGESVSVKDITGRSPVKNKRGNVLGDGAPDINSAEGGVTQPGEGWGPLGEEKQQGARTEAQKQAPVRRKAPTDSTNVAFEEWLRGRQPKDFLAEQEEVIEKNRKEFLESQRRRQDDLRAETVPTDWCYGPQTLNYVELKKAEMRERLAKDKGATYTYSMDYVSQTVSLVDESRLREDQEDKSKAAWKTKRGFVWPCPRTRQELITHPSKPSESRIDTLREPWIENELTGGGSDEAAGTLNEGPPALSWRREFDMVPSNGKTVFGGLQRPKYERPLDTDMIGSRSRLPRGRQQLGKDPEFFRSVHLVGEGLAREKEEAKRRAEELWRSKVVVEDTDFRVGNFNVRDTPLRVDRAKDILHPPVRKTAFKMVRNARLPSGKRTTLRPPPVSAFSLEPFVEPEDFTVSIRGNHRERWAAADPATGNKLDFYLRLHPDRMKLKSHKACARLKHPPLAPSEMRGPRWETKRAGTAARVAQYRDGAGE